MHAPFFSLEFLCISLWLLGRASCVVILLKWCKNIHPSYLHMWDPAIGFFCTFTVNCNCGGSMPRRWNFDHCSFANPPELSWWDSPSFPGERCPPGGEHNEPHAPPTPRVHLLLLRLQPASQRPAENAGCLHRLKTYVLKHYWKVCEEWFFFFFFFAHTIIVYCLLAYHHAQAFMSFFFLPIPFPFHFLWGWAWEQSCSFVKLIFEFKLGGWI